MILISEAIEIIRRETFSLEAETIDLNDSVERVLAENVFADMDLPPFDRAQMDGFAVKTKDCEKASKENPVRLKITGESIAGKGFDGKIKRGETARIMTGARVPKGADAVQKKESAREAKNEFSQKAESDFVEILEAVKPHQNFVARAAEIKKSSQVLEKGELIGTRTAAILASFGYSKIKVFQKPTVSILATGSEIVEVFQKPGKDQIRDSNSASLKAFAENTGAIAEILPRAKDSLENLKNKIAEIVGLKVQSPKSKNLKSQILILSGGVSVGDYDFTKPALRALGAKIFFEKVALRPGKPIVFAKLNDVLIFGLPGNPVSVAVTFHLFVRQAILRMQGAKNYSLKEGFAVLTEPLKGAKGRESFIPGRLKFGENAQVSVEPARWSGSSDFIGFARADCLIFVAQNVFLEKGETVKFIFLND